MQTNIVYAEPENAAFVEGKRNRVKGASPSIWIVAVVVFLLITPLGLNSLGNYFQTTEIRSLGADVEGQITRLSSNRRSGKGGQGNPNVSYRYEVEGRWYERVETVDRAIFNGLSIDSYVMVRYLPSNPQQARLISSLQAEQSLFLGGLFWIGVSLTPFAVPLVLQWQSNLYVRRGQLLEGTLISAEGREISRVGLQVIYKYTFRSPLGFRLSGRRKVIRNDLRKRLMPPPESPVKVLYIDDRNHRML